MKRRLLVIGILIISAFPLTGCVGTAQGERAGFGVNEQIDLEERTIAPVHYFYPTSQDVIYLVSEQFLLCRRKDFCPLDGHFTPAPVPPPVQERTVSAEPSQKKLEATIRSVVHFASGSSTLEAEEQAVLNQLLTQLNGVELSDLRVVIAGYTDSTGSEMMNNTIAHGRVEAVAAYFNGHGVAFQKVVVGSRPLCCYAAPNTTAEGRAKNRRVEIWVEQLVESNDERAN